MSKRASLSLVVTNNKSPISSVITSSSDSGSRSPSPADLRRAQPQSETRVQMDDSANRGMSNNLQKSGPISTPVSLAEPRSPTFTSLPQIPTSPKNGPKHAREQSRSFFANLKASKSTNRVHQVEPTIRQVSEDTSGSKAPTKENTFYSIRRSPGSTPDLSLSAFNHSSSEISDGGLLSLDGGDLEHTDAACLEAQSEGHTTSRPPVGTSVLSDSVVNTTSSEAYSGRRNKPRFAQLLTRTRSMRMDDTGGRRPKPTTPSRITVPVHLSELDAEIDLGGMRTAPLQRDRDQSFPDVGPSIIRNRSTDRQTPSKNQATVPLGTLNNHPAEAPLAEAPLVSVPGSTREGNGSHILTHLKNSSSKAAGGLGKASKGIFNKMTRSGSSTGKDGVEDRYVFKVISLPLVEQTRKTRIAKRLEDSKDKTEFWMPALPWRCIDYLNFKGCEVEGLYRIPGGVVQVKEYQKRFDQECDINLFDEHDLYDINIIGSLFKGWLRNLPNEILPKDTQTRISTACAGATEAPQMLKDALSSLPPWNYYLLFAITCHLSLLHAYVEQNRMDYNNLVVCFKPCLNIDAFCFYFLVCDWRNCWQGCWTEKEALAEEYRILENHSSSGESSGDSMAIAEECPPASSHSATVQTRVQERPRPPPLSFTQPSDEYLATPTGMQNGTLRADAHLPELAPVMPVSPIGSIGH